MIRTLSWMLLIILPLSASVEWKGEKGDIKVFIQLSSDQINLTDTLKIAATLTYPEKQPPDISQMKSNLLRSGIYGSLPFALKDVEIGELKQQAGLINQTIRYSLVPNFPGHFGISLRNIMFKDAEIATPFFDVEVIPSNGPLNELSIANPLSLDARYPVEISLENALKLVDGQSVREYEKRRNASIIAYHTFPWGLLGLSIITVGLIGLYFLIGPKEETEEQKKKRIKALNETTLLQLKGVPLDHPEVFYVRTTELLKSYIERNYQIQALKQTTEEFLHEIASYPVFSKSEAESLSSFLKNADRVKFARYLPDKKEMKEALNSIILFIDK